MKQAWLGLLEKWVRKVVLSLASHVKTLGLYHLGHEVPLESLCKTIWGSYRGFSRGEIRQESWLKDGKFLEILTSHFPDGKTEFLRRKVTCSISHSWWAKGLEPEPRSPDLKPVFFFWPWSSPVPSPHLGQSRPLTAFLNLGKALIPHVHTAMLSQEARNKFFFSGNALLPSLQNNVFIIAKPFPSLRRKCIPHDSPKLSGPSLQIQYVNSFVNIYSGWQLRETCGIN